MKKAIKLASNISPLFVIITLLLIALYAFVYIIGGLLMLLVVLLLSVALFIGASALEA